MALFVGRQFEMARLNALLAKDSSSLVVVKGRRRIGKSALVEQFGKCFDLFCPIGGLAPREGLSEQDQLRNFSEQMSAIFNIPALSLNNWTEAFGHLASHTRKGKILILLDEISWMADRQPDFAGKLKIAWDNQFKKNPRLILVLCGSVSSWIDRNILKDADFVGRVSLEIDLQELPLRDCACFWGKKKNRVSAHEMLKLLCTTGGVPKYLEEINPSDSAEHIVHRLFFDKGGLLFKEFDRIFNDIFNRRSSKYKEILRLICSEKLSALEISRKLKTGQNGDITEYLADLEASGFIRRDFTWRFDGRRSAISRFKIKDNYLRFYLKYVDPIKEKIEAGLYELRAIENLEAWAIIVGLQFENVVFNNLNTVVRLMGIDPNSIISAAPYLQPKTKQKKGCQIDLLIHTRFNTLYLCEMKFRKTIGMEVVLDLEKKIKSLKRPKSHSIRPVLIYEGTVSDEVVASGFFDKLIPAETLFEG